MTSPSASPQPSERFGHEPDKTSVWGTTIVIIALSVLLALVFLVVYVFWSDLRASREMVREPPELLAKEGPPFRSETWAAPVQNLETLQREQRGRLQGYAWLDRKAGRVRIPITRAMELLAGAAQPDTAPASEPASEPNSAPAGAGGTIP